jgi:hypothetical protein
MFVAGALRPGGLFLPLYILVTSYIEEINSLDTLTVFKKYKFIPTVKALRTAIQRGCF